MNRNVKMILVGVIILIIGIGFYFTPHLAAYKMKKAAENKDADDLSDYVDYPSLRESLKANFNAKMASEVTKKSKDGNPFEALGAALAAALNNPMIDALVTPESLAMLMKGEKPEVDEHGSSSKKKSQSEDSNTETSMSYKGFHRFVVKVKEKGALEEPVEFIFKRDGLISWKLSALRIP